MKIKTIAFLTATITLFFSSVTLACYSDAECANDQICNDAGQCVSDGRDWNTLKSTLTNQQSDWIITDEGEGEANADVQVEKLINQTKSVSKCLEKVRNNYAICMNSAGSNESKKTACLKTLQKAVLKCQS